MSAPIEDDYDFEIEWYNPPAVQSPSKADKAISKELAKDREGSLKKAGKFLYEQTREIPQQFAQGAATGSLGAYGSLQSLLGGPEFGELLSGQQARVGSDQQILDRMQQPGYVPSLSELLELSDDDLAPQYTRFPSSLDVEGGLRKAGAWQDPKTLLGRGAKRVGEFAGAGAALGAGGNALGMAVAPAIAGQALEEAGAPRWAQAAAELGAMFLKGPRSSKVSPSNAEKRQYTERLRDLGYDESEITAALRASEKPGFWEKRAKPTEATREQLQNVETRTKELIDQTLESSFPGIGEGIPSLKEAASELFSDVSKSAEGMTINGNTRFASKLDDIAERITNPLGNTAEQKEVINMLRQASKAAKEPLAAETYLDFYKNLNQMGKWTDPSRKERVLSDVKDGIMDLFSSQGAEGKALSKQFSEANKGWQKFKQAEKLTEKFASAFSDEGVNYKKLNTILENPSTRKLAEQSMGKDQASLLREISRVGRDVQGLEKRMESLGRQGGLSGSAIAGMWGLITLDPTLLAKSLIGFGSRAARKNLANKMLLDPEYQNLILKGMQAVKRGSATELANVASRLEGDFDIQFAED